MKRMITATLVLALAAPPAFGHHGWGSYDAAKPVTVTGPILTSEFVNPHATVTVKDGGKTWTLTLAPTSRMITRGALAEMLVIGKQIVAYGYPSTATPGEMRAERITIDGKTVELR